MVGNVVFSVSTEVSEMLYASSGNSTFAGYSEFSTGVKMERATGIEPASEAWEASILPMNYARNSSSRRNRPVDHIVTSDSRATGTAGV